MLSESLNCAIVSKTQGRGEESYDQARAGLISGRPLLRYCHIAFLALLAVVCTNQDTGNIPGCNRSRSLTPQIFIELPGTGPVLAHSRAFMAPGTDVQCVYRTWEIK